MPYSNRRFLSKVGSSHPSQDPISSGYGVGWGREGGKGARTGNLCCASSWVFLIGSAHTLDSEYPKQTRLCVLPNITLLGIFIVPSGNLHLFFLPHCCCFMEFLLPFVFLSLGLDRFDLLKYRGNCLVLGTFLYSEIILLFNFFLLPVYNLNSSIQNKHQCCLS